MVTPTTDRFHQYFSTITANLGFFHTGVVMGWSSSMVILLEEIYEHSIRYWLIIIPLLSASISAAFTGFVMDKYGRKTLMLISAVPSIFSWMLEIFIPQISIIYFARIVQGLIIGISSTVIPVYIGEISEPDIRGFLGSMMNVFLLAGQTVMFSLSTSGNYYVSQIPGLICSLLMLFVTIAIPESPAYLVQNGYIEKAEKALKTLRGPNYDTTVEIQALERDSERQRTIVSSSTDGGLSSVKEILKIPSNRISLLLATTTMVTRQFSGINVIAHYAGFIFEELTPTIPATLSSVTVGLTTTLVSLIVPPFLFDRLGRKVLLIISGIGMTVSFFVLSANFALLENDGRPFVCAAIISIFTYLISYAIGWGSGPWILLSELFSPEAKKVGVSLAVAANFICAFLTTASFALLIGTLGNSFAFYLLTITCALGVIFVVIALPETKKKTTAEIQREL